MTIFRILKHFCHFSCRPILNVILINMPNLFKNRVFRINYFFHISHVLSMAITLCVIETILIILLQNYREK